MIHAPDNRKSGALLALGMLAATPVLADALEDSILAFGQGHCGQAARTLSPLAKSGDPEALTILGHICRAGLGIPANQYKAFAGYRSAAEDGHLAAQFQLGTMYLEGTGVTEDEYAAIRWLTKAAPGGHENAKVVRDALFAGDFTIGC